MRLCLKSNRWSGGDPMMVNEEKGSRRACHLLVTQRDPPASPHLSLVPLSSLLTMPRTVCSVSGGAMAILQFCRLVGRVCRATQGLCTS